MKKKFGFVLAVVGMVFALHTTTYAGCVEDEVMNGVQSLSDDPQYVNILEERMEDLNNPQYLFDAAGYSHNDKFTNTTLRKGIDVSYYQGDIDWTAVKNSGVEYVFVRVGYRGYGEGTLAADPNAQKYIRDASAAGLRVGAYIFSQAISPEEGAEEAAFALSQISGLNISLPIVIDYEYVSNGVGRLYNANLNKTQTTDTVNAFCAKISSAGYTPMVYANKSMLETKMNASNIPYHVWLANYTTKTEYAGNYTFWQYTSKGTIPGITGNVDCDFWYDDGSSMLPGIISGVYIPDDNSRTIRAGAIINNSIAGMTYDCTVIDYSAGNYGGSTYPAYKQTSDKEDNWMEFAPTHPGMYGFCWRAYYNGVIVSEYGATHYFAGNTVKNPGIWIPDRNVDTLNFGMVFDSPDRENVRITWFLYRPDDGVYEAILSDGLVSDKGEWQQWTKKQGRYWIMCRVTAANNEASSECWGVEVRDGVVID